MRTAQHVKEENRLSVSRRSVFAICGILASGFLGGCSLADAEILEELRKNHTHPNCFTAATRIRTRSGDQRIENIRPGDSVLMLGGSWRKVRWIARRRVVMPQERSHIAAFSPIRFAKGSLGNYTPTADLLVSRDHRLYMRGMLIRAAEFVNNHSIAGEPLDPQNEIEYFHVLTEGGHGIIFAEGVPCETLLYDEQVLSQFDNFNALDIDEKLSSTGRERPCVPVFDGHDTGKRALLLSYLRSALSPCIDLRTECDRVRDVLVAARSLETRQSAELCRRA